MAFRKIKGSFKNRDLATHIIEDTYLAHDTVTGELRIGDGVTPAERCHHSGGGGHTICATIRHCEIASGGHYISRREGINHAIQMDNNNHSTGTADLGNSDIRI